MRRSSLRRYTNHSPLGMLAYSSAVAVFLLAVLAEYLHVRRVRVVGRLAFGPSARPRPWARALPLIRPACLALCTWGVLTLLSLVEAPADSGANTGRGEPTRLVFVVDLSPSMYLQDAGPEGSQTRRDRMRDVVDSMLARVSGNLRFGVIGFYTESLPVVMEARDPELVRNVLNGLPLTYAMPLGQTDLGQALNAAVKLVAGYPEGSTRLVVLTDGDSVNLVPISARPQSVKEVLILGIGNPHKGTYIDGHQSRQEGDTLQAVAAALSGTYADVNDKHVPTTALGDLVVTAPLPEGGLSPSALAVLAVVLGAGVYAFLPVALQYFGTDWISRDNFPRAGAKNGAGLKS